ncbi:hypothetical protein BJ166DRAFT_525746 [Pestalotiopsis sp. NC0098]|nr:hypothetical protein BJ166DRAFT_525746 [Pestalotiopsis sp. NC0098]
MQRIALVIINLCRIRGALGGHIRCRLDAGAMRSPHLVLGDRCTATLWTAERVVPQVDLGLQVLVSSILVKFYCIYWQ